MAQTPLTVVPLVQNNVSVGAGALQVAPAAMDATSGNSYPATGREVLFFQNSDTSAHHHHFERRRSAWANRFLAHHLFHSRRRNFCFIQMKYIIGWLQTNGLIYLATSSALVKVAVLQYN